MGTGGAEGIRLQGQGGVEGVGGRRGAEGPTEGDGWHGGRRLNASQYRGARLGFVGRAL
jgi:hypothetical protein